MKQMMRKLLAMLMVLMMLCSSMPIDAIAEALQGGISAPQGEQPADEEELIGETGTSQGVQAIGLSGLPMPIAEGMKEAVFSIYTAGTGNSLPNEPQVHWGGFSDNIEVPNAINPNDSLYGDAPFWTGIDKYYYNPDGVDAVLHNRPSNGEIEKVMPSYKPDEGDTVRWYIAKKQGNTWHVDGIIIKGSQRHSISYRPGAAGDNASGMPDPITTYYDKAQNVSVTGTKPTWRNHEFLGWSTNPSATQAEYTCSDTIYVEGEVILYAIWKDAKPSYTAEKSVDNAKETYAPGEEIYFTITITNDGQVDLSDITVSEALAGAEFVADEGYTIGANNRAIIKSLAQRQSIEVNVKYSVTDTDIASRTLTNTANVYSSAAGMKYPSCTLQLAPATKNITVTKHWVENIDGLTNAAKATLRSVTDPSSLITLSDGSNMYPATTVNSAENSDTWEYSFTVPADGEYTVVENYGNENYQTEIQNFTVTNTLKNTTSVTVTKKWHDADNQGGLRPDSVSVQLQQNDVPYGEAVTLNAANSWSYTWENLPEHVAGQVGTDAVYTVAEINVPAGYTAEVTGDAENGFIITNSPDNIQLTVTKKWQNADGTARTEKLPEGVTLQIKGSVEGAEDSSIQEVSLDAIDAVEGDASTWSKTVSVPRVDASGAAYSYSVVENDVPAGYSVSYSQDADNPNTLTVINKADQMQTLYIYAQIRDKAGNSVTGLYPNDLINKDGWVTLGYIEVPVDIPDPTTLSLQATGDLNLIKWDYIKEHYTKWENDGKLEARNAFLDEYGQELKPLNLVVANGAADMVTTGVNTWHLNCVVEVEPKASITKSVTPEHAKVGDTVEYTLTVTNTGDLAFTVDVTDTGIGEVENDIKYNWGNTPQNDQKTITYNWDDASHVNKWSIQNMQPHTTVTITYFYTIQDGDVEGKEVTNIATVNGNDDPENMSATATVEIHDPVTVSGTKTWIDPEGSEHPEVTIQLLRDGVAYASTRLDNDAYSFTDLPACDGDGNPYTYSVSEGVVEGYTKTNATPNSTNGIDFTNTINQAYRDIAVHKSWVDPDGTQHSPVTVTLTGSETKTLELNAANEWSGSFEHLPVYDGKGQVIQYNVTESVTGYNTEITPATANAESYEITNTIEQETVSVSGKKTWDDYYNAGNTRPESITIQLLRDGDVFRTQTVTGTDEGDVWTYSFTDLDKYDLSDGHVYDYTVEELPVSGYTSESDGTNFTNTLIENPGLTVTKRVLNRNSDYDLGDAVIYHITVENTGNLTLNDVTLTDVLKVEFFEDAACKSVIDVSGINKILAPGEKFDVFAKYIVTEDDIHARQIVNTATATGTDPNSNTVEDSGSVTVETMEPKPALTIEKTLTDASKKNSPFGAGDVAVFEITVTNTGNITLTDLEVVDQLKGTMIAGVKNENGDPISHVVTNTRPDSTSGQGVKITALEPNGEIHITAYYTVTQADVDAGTNPINKASAKSKEIIEPKEAEAVIPLSGNAALAADKRLTNSGSGFYGRFKAGETAKFDIVVKNVGDKILNDVIVTDTIADAKIVAGNGYRLNQDGTATIEKIPVGESVTVKAEYTVTQNDIDNRRGLANTATVKSNEVTNNKETIPEPIPLDRRDRLTSEKTLTNSGSGEGGAFKAGETATFDITVTNSGTTTQKNVVVTDTMAGAEIVEGNGYKLNADGTATIAEMAPGATVTVKAEYTVTQDDIDNQTELANTATVSGEGTMIGPDPEPIPTEKPNPKIAVHKLIDTINKKGLSSSETRVGLGDEIYYKVWVKNTGNLTLNNITVVDPMTGDEWTLDTLAPGAFTESWKTKPYTVTEDDILRPRPAASEHEVTNEVFATATASDGTIVKGDANVSADVDFAEYKLTATKTLTNGKNEDGSERKFKTGETATFDIVVENTGNITQTDVVVTEQLAGAKIVGITDANGKDVHGYFASGQTRISKIAPGEKVIVKAEYEVTQADIDNGTELANIATVDGEGEMTGPDPVPIPTEERNPSMVVAKSVAHTRNGTAYSGAAVAGDLLTYTVTITNDGNTTLTDLSVTDAKFPEQGITATIDAKRVKFEQTGYTLVFDTLPVRKTLRITYTYTVQESDMTRGRIVNGVQADANGVTKRAETTTQTEQKNTTFDITKSVRRSGSRRFINGEIVQPGDQLIYTITVSNTGNVALHGFLNDVFSGMQGMNWLSALRVTRSNATLGADGKLDIPAGESVTLEAWYTVMEADRGKTLSNTASYAALGETKEAHVANEVENPHLTISKTTTSTPENGEAYALGETITYSITATNDGNVTLTDVVVTDDLTGDKWTIESLEPGDNKTYTTSYTVLEKDILAGRVVNVATATGTGPNTPPTIVPGNTEDPTEPKNPSLEVEKTVTNRPANGSAYRPGETITYSITVTNNGNVTVSNITVTDPLTGMEETIDRLEPGATSETFTTSYNVTATDATSGNVMNTATATGTDPDGNTVTGHDEEIAPTAPTPPTPPTPVEPEESEEPEEQTGHVTITKRATSTPANGSAYHLGETITYEITATNDSGVAVSNVVVSDALTGANWSIASLAAGASQTFTTSYTVTAADVAAGSVRNVATASATGPDPENPDVPVDPGETVVPTEPGEGHLTITKAATSTPANRASYALGETVTYAITATNDGEAELANVTVRDELTNESWTIASLAPGASQTFTTSYTITEADIAAGSVRNVATGIAGTPDDPNNPDTPVDPGETTVPTEPERSALTVDKTAPAGPYGVGDTITYTITVTNSGNVTVTNITVTDPLTGMNRTIESIDPGQTQTFTTTYTVTQADVNAGGVTNAATASGTTPEGDPVTGGDSVTVEALERVTLTVRYWYGAVGGAVAAPTFTRNYFVGSRYNVASPNITGYSRNIDRVNGTINRDLEFDVIYTANTYTLTINYVYEDGTAAAPTVTQTHNAGDGYSVASPVIAGYTASDAQVAGTMPARDVIYTVIYVPNETEILIDEYGVPLNIGNVTMNVGDCFE